MSAGLRTPLDSEKKSIPVLSVWMVFAQLDT